MTDGKRRKFGGRKKGTPNRTTREVKDAILHAFHQAGGKDYLVRVAEEDPRTFLTLLGRVLPRDINASIEGITVSCDLVE